jgi:flagellar biosynthesis/type III secretory pathway protein FliH
VLAHLQALATRRDPQERLRWKLRLMRGLYDRGHSKVEVQELFRLIDWVLELPEELEPQFWADLTLIEQESGMAYVTSVERMALRKGEEIGLQKGREEGVREGLLKGLELGLELRFGSEGQRLLARIGEIQEQAVLETLLTALLNGAQLDELKQLL